MRVKNQLAVPQVRISVGDGAVRVAGASLWNNMHKDMTQYRLRICFNGKSRKHIRPNTTFDVLIDACSCLCLIHIYLYLYLKIALFQSELSCHFFYIGLDTILISIWLSAR